ncbi:shufflon system plasmid conjugative transfer pilus tip adhesin PilV [Acidithiobacillus sp. IBUN Pt1247-S3]|uniref:shufflon system plasmid conjugative transfer pilus tip adhesin PilV n=1 Tax=Acidithiobacillus sp. IBUN Pt1247-S3 TaxID=3166642 RepID=UPI0034E40550
MNPIAFLFMVIAAAGLTPLLYYAISSQGQQEMATAAAMQMARVDTAAQAYITANAAAVAAASTATAPAIITVPMLINTGYLPNGFNSNNPYGQVWQVQVLQPQPNQLQALVVSIGGQNVDAKQAGQAAMAAGASGGVIGGGTGKFAVPGCNGGTACGVYAGWQVSTSGYQNVAPGHLAALIEYSNGQLQSDYLYRTAVPGQPQLNTMQTNLDMGANDINNAQNVNVNQDVTLGNPGAATGGSPASNPGQLGVDEPAGQGFPSDWGGGIHTWDLYANGTLAAGENGSQGAYMNDDSGGFGSGGESVVSSPNGANYAYMNANNGGSSVVTNGTVQGGYVNSTGNVNAQNTLTVNGGNAWWANNAGDSSQAGNADVNGQVQAGYDVTLGTAGGDANIGWGCGQYGAIAANANGSGQILACQGGTWQAMGGSNGQPLQMYSQDLFAGQTMPGYWQFCASTSSFLSETAIMPSSGPYSNGTYIWSTFANSGGQVTYASIYTCYNLPGVYIPSNP